MKERYLESIVPELCFPAHKMAFISGPRQCGKTTLAKRLMKLRDTSRYFNWDDVNFRRIWVKNPSGVISTKSHATPLIVLDEIHKAKAWKRSLKGVYDTLEYPADIIVTGSARLNIYNKQSDSLLGRYFHFRLHPFTIREINNQKAIPPKQLIANIFGRSQSRKKRYQSDLDSLMKFGGFPEPLLGQNEKRARIWRKNRVNIVIREDLRDLSRIPELSQVEMLAALLPDKVGSLFSLTSLREDLEVSYPTVRRWINFLKDLYYLFEIKPYKKSIVRSIKKEGKVYLWDYSELSDGAARFENLIACHLLKACHYWSDTGEGDFELTYLRDKQKNEIDFLILKNNIPWLPIEVKISDVSPSKNWARFSPQIPCKHAIQILKSPNYWQIHRSRDSQLLVGSASEILSYFV